MLQVFGQNSSIVIIVMFALATIFLVSGAYVLWQSHRSAAARRLARRLRALSAAHDRSGRAALLRQRSPGGELPRLERLLHGLPRVQRFDQLLLQAGLHWSVARLFVTSAVFALVGMLGLTEGLHQPALLALLCAAAAGTLPFMYVLRKRTRRLGKIQTQLPDALDLVTRALRAGHAFAAALQMIGEEMNDPIASEFRVVSDEVNFGVSLQQALTHLSDRLPITDLRYFVVAVLIQRDSGGNLTEVLGNLSRLIRERLKLFAKVRVLSSDGRLSAWVLGLMPFMLAGGMFLVNRKFMEPLWLDPIGQSIIRVMLIMMAIGLLILTRIVRIRV